MRVTSITSALALSAGLAWAESSHKIAGIGVSGENAVVLALTGSAPTALQKSHDIFPLDVSADLINWQALAMVVRTNVTNEIPSWPRVPRRLPCGSTARQRIISVRPFSRPPGRTLWGPSRGC